MNTKPAYIFLLILLLCNNTYGMKTSPQKLSLPDDIALNIEEIWFRIIALCSAKYKLRETCTYFRDTASISNEKIFLQNPLIIKQDLLEQYALYFAELDNYAILCNLLNQRLNPNIIHTDYNKSSLLHYAVQNKKIDINERSGPNNDTALGIIASRSDVFIAYSSRY